LITGVEKKIVHLIIRIYTPYMFIIDV